MAPHIKIKIGTVVAEENYSLIADILDELPLTVDVWKLYQLSQSKVNTTYYMRQHIKDDKVKSLVDSLKKRYKLLSTRIQVSYERERNGRYLFLEPDGTIMTVKDGIEYPIGNYKECNSVLIKKIEEHIDSCSVNSNFYNSFGVTL